MFSNYCSIPSDYHCLTYNWTVANSSFYFSAKRQNLKSERRIPKRAKYDYRCEVCGDLSSGYHYGAFTCEACKLFFSRTTKNKRKRKFDECLSKNCDISVQTRSDCSECRFKKCLFKGMSLTKSKFGRNVVFKNEPKPVNVTNQSGKLVELFFQIGQKLSAIIYNSNENNLYQTLDYLRTNLNYLLDKSVQIIDTKINNDSYKFLKNYNIYFPIQNYRKLDGFTILFFGFFAIDFNQILAYDNKNEIFKVYYDNKSVYDLYLGKINTIVSNLSYSSAYLVKILLFLRIFNSLQSLEQPEAVNKIDSLIKEMILNEFILNKFICNEFSAVDPSFLDNTNPFQQILFISTQFVIYFCSF